MLFRSILSHRIPDCALNFVTYQTLKNKISPTLAVIRQQAYTSKSKLSLVKPEMYLPAPASYSYNFLLNLKKGCKYFRELMPHNLYNQLDWKCFEHHQTKIQDLTTAEEERIAKTSVKGNLKSIQLRKRFVLVSVVINLLHRNRLPT